MLNPSLLSWGEPTRTLVSWRQGFRHSTRSECMGWLARIFPSSYELFREVNRGRHNTLEKFKIFLNLTGNCCPSRLTLKNTLPLHSWRLLVHNFHIECSSPARSEIQYMCTFPLNKQAIDWDFISDMNPLRNHVIDLEVRKKYVKSSLALRLKFVWLTILRDLNET